MHKTIMLIPTDKNVYMDNVIIGIFNIILKKGIKLNFLKFTNIYENNDDICEMPKLFPKVEIYSKVNIQQIKLIFKNNRRNELTEKILSRYYNSSSKDSITILEGFHINEKFPFIHELNQEIANLLGTKIIFISSSSKEICNKEEFENAIFSCKKNENIAGVIFNKADSFILKKNKKMSSSKLKIIHSHEHYNGKIPFLGSIFWKKKVLSVRIIDIFYYLKAESLYDNIIRSERIESISFYEGNIKAIISSFHKRNLILIHAKEYNAIILVCLLIMQGKKIGALLLVGKNKFPGFLLRILKKTFEKKNIPVLVTNISVLETIKTLEKCFKKINVNDKKKIERIKKCFKSNINLNIIDSILFSSKTKKIYTPSIFLYNLSDLARKSKKIIVLPEGNDLRIIKAASICSKRNIAHCVLLGNPDEIRHIAYDNEIDVGSKIEIILPESIKKNYIDRLVFLRKHKGMTNVIANKQLKNNIVLGTMMLERGDVDGMVSGIANTTANTIRPSLQIIKTDKKSLSVSSIFLMLLKEEVLVYGDCAININPNEHQLSEIAIQSAESAILFGINPKIAMISYSTGNSGFGKEVEKVKKATEIVRTKRPDLIIDGPLQYDAAVSKDVARHKSPQSPVAGEATVFIFPDLNTGNTTYKAVQRTSKSVCIGPILQGIRKPVNDLSRGSSVEDIVYTIAITSVQASKRDY
ncbi:hypothetical protein AOQ88_01925 [Candidatus Riesia sp. GBBU]|nr:hypothetical protein AOQ88_01925 [Candidatus Riesia sp. GBBU]